MAARIADIIQIVMLPPRADALLRGGGPAVFTLFGAKKRSLNWFIPAFVNKSVGSLAGTSEEECTRRCPLVSKKRKNSSRISFPVRNCMT